MSRKHVTNDDRADMNYVCPTCHAARRQWCKTQTGKWSKVIHVARIRRVLGQ